MSANASVPNPDLAPADKVKFVAIVLPSLGALGGIMQLLGWPQQVVIVTTVAILCVTFFVSHFSAIGRRANEAELKTFEKREARMQGDRRAIIAKQREELRRRQEHEQDLLMKNHPSRKQLAEMMDRHRQEYDALLRKQSA